MHQLCSASIYCDEIYVFLFLYAWYCWCHNINLLLFLLMYAEDNSNSNPVLVVFCFLLRCITRWRRSSHFTLYACWRSANETEYTIENTMHTHTFFCWYTRNGICRKVFFHILQQKSKKFTRYARLVNHHLFWVFTLQTNNLWAE